MWDYTLSSWLWRILWLLLAKVLDKFHSGMFEMANWHASLTSLWTFNDVMECHASKHAPKHALKYDIFWTSLWHQKWSSICRRLHGNIRKQTLVKDWPKVGKKSRKRLVNCWQKSLAQHRPNVRPISPHHCLKVGLTLAQRWLDVESTLATLGCRKN